MAHPLHLKRLAAIAAALTLAWVSVTAWAAPGDPDCDGLPTQVELLTGTDPLIADSDSDGLLDGAEVNILSTDPLRDDSDALREIDGYEDNDGDGFSNGAELANGANPLVANDAAQLKIITINRTASPTSTPVGTPVTVAWTVDPGTDFASYIAQFDGDATFASPVEVTYTPAEALTTRRAAWKRITREGRVIYWRVLGLLANGRRFSSEVSSFLITGGPALLSPAPEQSASWDPAQVPTFSWTGTPENQFRLFFTSREKLLTGMVANPADGTWSSFAAASGGRSWTPSRRTWRGITSLGKDILWRVASKDSRGRYAFSEWSELTLAGGAAAGTASVGPNQAAGPDTIPTFYCRPGTGASKYRLLFSGSGDYSAGQTITWPSEGWSGVTEYTPTADEWKALTALGPTLFWVARGWNDVTRIYTTSDIFTYEIGTSLLGVEGMESAGLNVVDPGLPTFTLGGPFGAAPPWQDFQVIFAGDPQAAGDAARDPADSFQTGSTWTMGSGLPSQVASLGPFPWIKVRGRTASGNSFFSPAYQLVSSAFLRAPVLGNPGASVEPTERYSISWNRSPDDNYPAEPATVLHYELQEATNSKFTADLKSFDVDGTSRNFRHSAVTEQTTFYYRVRAVNSVGHSIWSNIGKKKVVPAASNWSPVYTTVQPCTDGGDNYVIDDAQNNSRGKGQHFGPGWVSRVEAGFGSFGFMGDYHYITSYRNPSGSENADFIPNIAKAGLYEVFVGFFVTANRDDHVEFFVKCDTGTYGPFVVNQRTSSHTGAEYWVSLGKFRFEAGTSGMVHHQFSALGISYSEEIDVAAFKWVSE